MFLQGVYQKGLSCLTIRVGIWGKGGGILEHSCVVTYVGAMRLLFMETTEKRGYQTALAHSSLACPANSFTVLPLKLQHAH